MTSRRARPTLRVLRDDLRDGWESTTTRPRQSLNLNRLDALSPLSELKHPVIRKAVENFGDDTANDNPVGPLASSKRNRLWEIKVGQWRGAVWVDEATNTCWLIAAGLAKGEHEDHDDFYERLKRAEASGETERWLPTEEDRHLLKRETAARLIVDWELEIQRRVAASLKAIAESGTSRFTIPQPQGEQTSFGECVVSIETLREHDNEREELVAEIELAPENRASDLGWTAIMRILIAICPPETDWDRYGDSYSNIADIGTLVSRTATLEALTSQGELAQSRPNDKSHYSHRKNLASSTVNGLGVRSLCGIYFVPTQDHLSLPLCSTCEERYAALP